MAILITGAAGFIGYHLCQCLIARGEEVIGIDDLGSVDKLDSQIT